MVKKKKYWKRSFSGRELHRGKINSAKVKSNCDIFISLKIKKKNYRNRTITILRRWFQLKKKMEGTILMLVNELNKKDKENFKSLGKSLGLEIKKGLHRNTSVNEYVCFNVHCSKGVFDTIRTFCVTEIWNPSRKTRNCNRDTL